MSAMLVKRWLADVILGSHVFRTNASLAFITVGRTGVSFQGSVDFFKVDQRIGIEVAGV